MKGGALTYAGLITAIFSLLTVQANAGTAVSGGGSARLCFHDVADADKVRVSRGAVPAELLEESRVKSIEAFDLYESKLPRGIDLQTPKIVELLSGETPSDYVRRVLRRAYQISPDLYNAYRGFQEKFPPERIKFIQAPLRYDGDEGTELDFSSGPCVLVAMAKQENRSDDWNLIIDQRLFEHPKNSRLSRAALFLHEALYAIARENGASDSAATRKLVGMFMTEGDMPVYEYIRRACKLVPFKTDSSYGPARSCGEVRWEALTFPVRITLEALRIARESNFEFWLNSGKFTSEKIQTALIQDFEEALSRRLQGWEEAGRFFPVLRESGFQLISEMVSYRERPLSSESIVEKGASNVLSFSAVELKTFEEFSPLADLGNEGRTEDVLRWFEDRLVNYLHFRNFPFERLKVPKANP